MKAVSPIVATILIVMITVALSLFLWYFLSSYISGQTQGLKEICMNNIEIRCEHNNTHTTNCVLKHIYGKKTYNLTIDIICLDNGKNKTHEFEIMDVGNIISISPNFECSKNIVITVSGVCEGFKNKQIFYECKEIKCFYQ